MAFNKEKITSNAMKFLQKGALDKAVHEYEKILEIEPNDERTLQKIGDLYARMNRKQEALNAYNRVSKLYTKQGFFLKAIAVYKQILGIDPTQTELYAKLAEMYHQLGLLTETIQQYEILVKNYEDSAKYDKALEIMKKMCRIDPDNLPNRIKYAESIIKHGEKEEGLKEYDSIIDELKKANREDEYVRVLERFTSHAPDKIERNLELARVYLDRGETRKGLSRLKSVLKLDTENLETLALLSRAFKGLNQLAKTITVLREMARIYKEQDDQSNLKEVLEQILAIDPENAEAKTDMDKIMFESIPPGADTASFIGENESQLDELQSLSEIGETIAPQTMELSVADVELDHQQDKAEELSLDPADIMKIQTEAEVFVKYGLHDQALERLLTIVKVQPDNLDALKYLGETYAALDELEKAEESLIFAVILLLENNKTDEAKEVLEEAWTLEANTERLESYLNDFDSVDAITLAERLRSEYKGGPESSSGVMLTASTLPKPLSQSQPNLSEEEQELLLGKSRTEDDADEMDEVDEIEYMEDDIDFDQDVELIEDDSDNADELVLDTPEIEFDNSVEVGEPEIVEEIQLPAHMVNDSSAQNIQQTQNQSAAEKTETARKRKPKPPKLPTLDDIEVQEEFDDQSVDELLIEDVLLESAQPVAESTNRQDNLELTAEGIDSQPEDDDDDFGEILDLDDIEDDEEETFDDAEEIPDESAIEIEPEIEELPELDIELGEEEQDAEETDEGGTEELELPETTETEEPNFSEIGEIAEPAEATTVLREETSDNQPDEQTLEIENLEFLDPSEGLRESEEKHSQGEDIPTIELDALDKAEQVVAAKLTGIDPAVFEEQDVLREDDLSDETSIDTAIELDAEVETEAVEDEIELEAEVEAEAVEDEIELEAEVEAKAVEDEIELEAEVETEAVEDEIELEAEVETEAVEDEIELEAEVEAEAIEDEIELEAEVETEAVEDEIELDAEELVEDVEDFASAPPEDSVDNFMLIDEFVEADDKRAPDITDVDRSQVGDDIILAEELTNILSPEEMEDYEEAQFFYQQGMYNECIQTYEELLKSHPSNPILGKLVDECKVQITIEDEKKAAQKAEEEQIEREKQLVLEKAEKEKQPQDGTVNLSDEIFADFDLDEDQEVPVPEVENKSPIKAGYVANEDIETHFNLGIAYKEMGLINEAIGEFLVALKSGQSVKTAVILAICYLEKNNTDKAAEFMAKALASKELTKLRLLEIRYDLAMFYLSKQQNDKALLQFKTIEVLNPAFHDVQTKVTELSAKTTEAEKDKLSELLDSVDMNSLKDDPDQDNVSFL